jgi:hypothetical protein
MKHIFEKLALILDHHQRLKQSDLSARMDAVLQRMKDSSYKHLRGRHNQLDHAWNRGMGRGGGGGADLAPNQMGPVPTQDFYRKRKVDLINQQRTGQIGRDEASRQLQEMRGMTRNQPAQSAQPASIPRQRTVEPKNIMLEGERRHQALIPKGPQPTRRMLDDGDLTPADRKRRNEWIDSNLMGDDTANPRDLERQWYAMETDRRARQQATQPAANAQPTAPAAQLSTGPVDMSALPRVDDMIKPGEAVGQEAPRLGTAIQSTPYDRQTPVRIDTSQPGWMVDALERIQRGELVEFSNEGEAYTGIKEIARYAKELKEKGKNGNFNLCKVTVPGTNLFCGSSIATDRHPNGVPRIEMPQLSGKVMSKVRDANGNEVDNPAVQGMPLKVDKDGKPTDEVDIAPFFVQHLAKLGIGSREGVMRASNLRASQNELKGPNVGFFMTDSGQEIIDNEPIFVSRDGFVIDGHHRWAGKIGVDLADGQQGDTDIRVVVIDAPIMEVLQLAIDYTADKIQPKAA